MGPFLINAFVLGTVFVAIRALVKGSWPHRHPCSALILWCGILLSAPVALLGSLTMFATDRHLLSSDHAWTSALAVASTLAIAAVIVRIGLPAAVAQWRARKTRSRHRNLLTLFAQRYSRKKRVFLVPDDRMFAYSVPSLLHGDIVVSRGFVDNTPNAIREAVLAHERFHLLSRHHLLLQGAIAAADSVPGPTFAAFPERISILIEMAADCWASWRHTPRATIASLLVLADMHHPAATLPAGGRDVALRLKFLSTSQSRCCRTLTSAMILSTAVATLIVPSAVVLSNTLLDLCFLLQEK